MVCLKLESKSGKQKEGKKTPVLYRVTHPTTTPEYLKRQAPKLLCCICCARVPQAGYQRRDYCRNRPLGRDRYGNEYWRSLEPNTYPQEFVAELTSLGWLGSLIPEEYGGGGLSLGGASVILEEISASGGNPSACHAQMYVMGTVLRHGSEDQKSHYLPQVADGRKRLQAFGVTEPEAGSNTTMVRTRAERDGDVYRITGQAVVLEGDDGARTLRLTEEFSTPRGPQLVIYLRAESGEFVNLGALQSLSGEQDFEIPADIDISEFSEVQVWCEPFGINFGSAFVSAA